MRGVITRARVRVVVLTVLAWILFLIAAVLAAIAAVHLIAPPS